MSSQTISIIKRYAPILSGAAMFFLFYLASLYNFQLLHIVAEIFITIVAFGIFVIAWNSRKFLENDYLLLLGISYLFIGVLNLIHIFNYQELTVLYSSRIDMPNLLLVFAHYLQAISFLLAYLLFRFRKRLNYYAVFGAYLIVFLLIILSVFYWNVFSAIVRSPAGMIAFNKASSYIIFIIYIAAALFLYKIKRTFDSGVFKLIAVSLLAAMVGEILLILSNSIYDSQNIVGIFLSTVSFYLVYKAIIETGFGKPYHLIFRDLKQSQERYEILVEHAPEAIGVYTNGEFVYMNAAGLELFGAEKPKEMLGKKTLSFIHPQYRDSIRQYVQKLRRGEKAEPLREFQIMRLDGGLRYVEAVSSDIIYEGKKSTQVVIRDITDRKHKEAELRRTNEFNKTLLNMLPFAIDIVDEKGNILFISKKLEETFDSSIIGKKCWEMYKDNKKQCDDCPLKKGVKIGETSGIETHGAFGGKIFKVVHTGMIFQDKKAVMEIFSDITEQKTIEKITQDAKVYAENIVNTVRDPLVVLDSDLRIVSANWAFYYTFRFVREKTEKELFYEIYDNHWNIAVLRESLEKVIKNNIPIHNLEISHEFPAIGQRTMIFNARRIYQTSGQAERFLLSIRDVTEKKRAEEQIRQSEEKHRNIFDNASDAVLTIDMADNITSWNKSAERIFGWKSSEAMGKKFGALAVPAELKKERKNILNNVFSGEYLTSIETVRLRKDGSRIDVSMATSPIFNEKREIVGLSSIIRDVTRQKEIDKAKTEFVSIASHELRTPLASMSLSTEMVLDAIAGPLNPEQKKYIRGISRDIKGMAGLVDALLNVSRIELRTMIIEPEPASLREIAETVLKELTLQIAKKDLKVKKSFDPALPIIDIDRNLTRIILQNLLSNAIKYTPLRGRIGIEIVKEKNDALIKVFDTGFGIPKDQQHKIFQKLFRAKNAIDQRSEGIGLVLYIVKSIVEQCGGKIWFESEENKGTAFFVRIPLAGMKKVK